MYVIFCSVMHQKRLQRQEVKSAPHQKVGGSPDGPRSRQHLTAIHLSTACIYRCAAMKIHLYKSVNLTLCHKVGILYCFKKRERQSQCYLEKTASVLQSFHCLSKTNVPKSQRSTDHRLRHTFKG